MGFYQLYRKQIIPASLEEVWKFISSPSNLKKITPLYMGFDILTENLPPVIYPGMIVVYQVRPLLGIPVKWVTEITHVKDYEYFVDEQRSGPYSIWHHEHHISTVEGGVLMKDIVSYKPPYGILGAVANSIIIRHKLNAIFNFREQAINQIFRSREQQSDG